MANVIAVCIFKTSWQTMIAEGEESIFQVLQEQNVKDKAKRLIANVIRPDRDPESLVHLQNNTLLVQKSQQIARLFIDLVR